MPDKIDPDKISALAVSMTEMHMKALRDLGGLGVAWTDLVFAAVLALRSLSHLSEKDDKKAERLLRRVMLAAMRQTVIAKRFKSQEELDAFVEENGLDAPPHKDRH